MTTITTMTSWDFYYVSKFTPRQRGPTTVTKIVPSSFHDARTRGRFIFNARKSRRVDDGNRSYPFSREVSIVCIEVGPSGQPSWGRVRNKMLVTFFPFRRRPRGVGPAWTRTQRLSRRPPAKSSRHFQCRPRERIAFIFDNSVSCDAENGRGGLSIYEFPKSSSVGRTFISGGKRYIRRLKTSINVFLLQN